MLQHVSLETHPRALDAGVAFWALLGFEPVDAPEGIAGRAAWLERRGTQIHLLLTEEPVVAPHGHVAVVVDDYDAALERLRAAGHRVEDRARHWGAARAYVRTPGGHLVEVMAAPPPTRSAASP